MKVALALVLILAQTAVASTEDVYQKNKETYIQTEVRNRNVLGDIYKAQKKLKELNSQSAKLTLKTNRAEQEINKLSNMILVAEDSVAKEKKSLRSKLSYISRFQEMGLFKILFSSQSPIELDRNLKILKRLTEEDFKQLKSYFKNTKLLKQKQRDLLVKEKRLVELKTQFAKNETILKRQLEKKNRMLVQIQSQKENLLSQLQTIREKTRARINENELGSDDMKKQEFLATVLEPLFFEKKGELESPYPGRVLLKFGAVNSSQIQSPLRYKGIFIKSKLPSEVRSIYQGRVSFVGDIPFSGKTVIIDHGDQYFSIYSGLEQITVDKADSVFGGQAIAREVSNNPFHGKGLYFEIRHFSEPIDPEEWIRR